MLCWAPMLMRGGHTGVFLPFLDVGMVDICPASTCWSTTMPWRYGRRCLCCAVNSHDYIYTFVPLKISPMSGPPAPGPSVPWPPCTWSFSAIAVRSAWASSFSTAICTQYPMSHTHTLGILVSPALEITIQDCKIGELRGGQEASLWPAMRGAARGHLSLLC